MYLWIYIISCRGWTYPQTKNETRTDMQPVSSVFPSLNKKKTKISMWGKNAMSEWEINWPFHRQNMQAWLNGQ